MPFVIMFAGPNGSGKTTLIQHIQGQGIDLGHYINADDIAATLSGGYDQRVREAQAIADQRRETCLRNGEDFSFETVMSHPSKVEFLARATAAGFDSTLYFISTENPALNVARVAQRVAQGGHDVPTDRIVARYARTMALLPAALMAANQAFVFENSGPGGLELGLVKETTRKSDGSGKASYHLLDGAPKWIREAYDAITAT
jgi:predicted ABC-type ATPase